MYYFGDALGDIKKIKALPDGHLDLESLPAHARKIQLREGKEEVTHRDLGGTVSLLTVAVQQLLERVEVLEKKCK
jgi:hypothetical protein